MFTKKLLLCHAWSRNRTWAFQAVLFLIVHLSFWSAITLNFLSFLYLWKGHSIFNHSFCFILCWKLYNDYIQIKYGYIFKTFKEWNLIFGLFFPRVGEGGCDIMKQCDHLWHWSILKLLLLTHIKEILHRLVVTNCDFFF